MNTTNLKSINFHKMLKEAQVIKSEDHDTQSKIPQMTKKKVDLIFCSVNKHKSNMTFDVFLQTLIRIGEQLYLNFSPSQALQKLVRTHLLPLHDRIIVNQKLNLGI